MNQSQQLFASLIMVCAFISSSLVNAFELHGEITQGGLVVGHTSPNAKVTLDGSTLPVSKEGIFVFGFDRDAPSKAKLSVTDGEQVEVRELLVKPREYIIQRVEGVPEKTVTPPPEELKRIQREAELVAKARKVTSERTDFVRFDWPLTGRISGVYGSQRFYNGEPRRPHYGIDIAAPNGTDIKAPADGVVTLAEPDLFFSGGTLIIDHGYGVSSTMMHLSAVLVKVGDEIQAGDVVAKVGSTGRSTGPHLDWRINWRDRRLDAGLVVPPMPKITHN